MQHTISKLVSLIVLLFIMNTVHAQNDSIKMKAEYKMLLDTLRLKHNVIVMNKDSIFLQRKHKRADSMYHKVMKNSKYRSFDSLSKKKTKFYTSGDTLLARKMLNRQHKMPDSLRKIYYKRFRDSTYAFKKFRRLDSLHSFKSDTLYRKMKTFRKLDSLKIRELKSRLVQDSMKFKQLKFYYLQDSIKYKLKQKEVTMELLYKKGSPVYISNVYQAIVISTNNGNTVRLSSKVFADKELSDQQWFDELKIEAKQTDSGISIRTIPVFTGTTTITRQSNAPKDAFTYTQKMDIAKAYAAKNTLYISVPFEAPLKLVTKYADVVLENNISSISIDISNGQFRMRDAGRLIIKSRYAGLQAGNIGDAGIVMDNSTLSTSSINTLVIDSKNSKVNFGTTTSMRLKSLNDQYELQQVNYLEGNKSFGRLNILSLDNDLDINASSADIKIGRIDDKAGSVKISNRYANVSLPLNKLPNYTVNVEGSNSHVLRGPDANLVGERIEKKQQPFTASAGNVSGTHTRFQLNCNSCMIDLR